MENILEILETGESQKKIEILETLHDTDNLKILQQIISRLNDDSIQVRGEAFNALLLNSNDIEFFNSIKIELNDHIQSIMDEVNSMQNDFENQNHKDFLVR